MEDSETDCREVLRRLYAYIDGEIAAGECADIERHLRRCGYCVGQADFERDLKMVVKRKCGEQLPEGLVERVRVRLRAFIDRGPQA